MSWIIAILYCQSPQPYFAASRLQLRQRQIIVLRESSTPLRLQRYKNLFAQFYAKGLRAGGQFVFDWLLNYSGAVFPALTAIVLIPVMVRVLGAQSYGLWITAATIASLLGILDLGFGAAVVRETGVARGTCINTDTQLFIRSVGSLVIILAVGCTLIMTVVAVPLCKPLHLPLSLQKQTPLIFGLYGLAFLGDWLFDYARSILIGLGRFGLVSLLSTSGAIMRASGVAVVLTLSNSLIPVAVWWASCQLLVALLALRMVGRTEPLFSFRLRWPHWQSLISRAPFSLGMVVCNSLYNFIWQIPVLATSFLLGPAALVPYYIGQKFPVGALGFVHSGGEVLYVSSSAGSGSEDRHLAGMVLQSALRWNFFIMLPLLIVFTSFAPVLFAVWIRVVPMHVVAVARIVVLAALMDTVCAPVLNSLWGRGLIRQTLVALSMGTSVCGIVGLLLIPSYGLEGAAIGLFVGSATLAVHLIWMASHFFEMSPFRLMNSISSFLIPALLCAATGYMTLNWLNPARWVSLIIAAIPAWAIFYASFYFLGASRGDRKKIRELLGFGSEAPVQPLLR